MDYFAYTTKSKFSSIPKAASCLRYTASLFRSKKQTPLSSSLPSPPITPQIPFLSPSVSLPAPSKKTVSRLRVLLVDDNPINLQILSRLLSTHMSNVFGDIKSVKSGVKALDVLKSQTFDLILMDIDMPILNGVDTARQIRSNHDILHSNRSVPIVAVTTNDSDDWCQLYTQVGMSGCISKPIVLNNLISTLCCVLDVSLPQSPYTPE